MRRYLRISLTLRFELIPMPGNCSVEYCVKSTWLGCSRPSTVSYGVSPFRARKLHLDVNLSSLFPRRQQ
jgi:hypothetical protein